MGETPFLEEQFGTYKHSATIKAETPCFVIRIPQGPMESILERYPEIKKMLKDIHDARVSHRPRVA